MEVLTLESVTLNTEAGNTMEITQEQRAELRTFIMEEFDIDEGRAAAFRKAGVKIAKSVGSRAKGALDVKDLKGGASLLKKSNLRKIRPALA